MILGPYVLGPTEDEHQGVYTGDALAVMSSIPPQTVDAVIIDPQYCSGAITEAGRTRASHQGIRSETVGRFGWFGGDNMGTAGLVWLLRSVALESARVCKASGSFLVFCDWRMIPSLEPAIESAGLRWRALVVWDKGHYGLGTGFRHQHECILHYTFGSPEYGSRSVGDVITASRVRSAKRVHPTQKPVELLVPLVEVVSPPGGVVLDVFAGSATTAEAAILTGRRYLMSDIDPDVVAAARERLCQIKPQLPGMIVEQPVMNFSTESQT